MLPHVALCKAGSHRVRSSPCDDLSFALGPQEALELLAVSPVDVVVSDMSASKRPTSEIERELLGTTHAELGAYLLGMWGWGLRRARTRGASDQTGSGTSSGEADAAAGPGTPPGLRSSLAALTVTLVP